MIRNVLKFAQTNPNINFIFKSKSKIVDKNFLKKVAGYTLRIPLPCEE